MRGPYGAPSRYMAVANRGRKASRRDRQARLRHPAAGGGELTELQRARQGALGFGGQLRFMAADEMRA